ncbi:MAG: AMP-binding protein [bacterium]|nr:AMP-binding protein [bacterium]
MKKLNFKDVRNQKIECGDVSIYEGLRSSKTVAMENYAINYFGYKMTFSDLFKKIDVCAKSLVSYGVRKGDVITVCMPNTPEAIIMIYAANKIGAIVNLVHPLSSKEELKKTIIDTNSVFALVINFNYEKIKSFISDTNLYKVIIVSAGESMPSLLSLGYWFSNDVKINFTNDELFIDWKSFLLKEKDYAKVIYDEGKRSDAALYLHSGGTTGSPKNIVLTNGNINSIISQARIVFPDIGDEDNFLSILPIFHCFGLVVCVCAPLALGAMVTLIPQFNAQRFDKLIKRYHPSVIAGVPTLFEALIKNPYMINTSLKNIKYVISGGDSLSAKQNAEVNKFLKEHDCRASVIQGYGMTETTGPATFGYFGSDKLGSVGASLPGNKIMIANPNTNKKLKNGEVGEILISGPGVMKEYLNNKTETDNMKFDDGKTIWIKTGDLGYLDEDEVLFYVQRLKRMLIVSGYNVYPNYIESVLLKHPAVKNVGVVGMKHPYKVQVPIAFVVINDEYADEYNIVGILRKYCDENLTKYMIPYKFIIKDELPKTMIGKTDYKELEKEVQK